LELWIRCRLSELRKKVTPVFDEDSGKLRYRKRFVRSDPETNEYTRLEYDSAVKKNAILFLDDERHGISKITCSSKWLNISYEPDADIHLFKGQTSVLFHGSSLWGCLDEQNNPTAIFKKIKSLVTESKSNTRYILSYEAEDCSPFLFFGDSTVSFFTNHSMIDVQDVRSMLKKMGGNAHPFDAAKSARGNLRAAYPDNKNPMGYGARLDLFNWNYDPVTDGAVENTLTVPRRRPRIRRPYLLPSGPAGHL
jgi:hypothetical protein